MASAARGLAGWWLPTGRIRRRDWWVRYFLVFVLFGVVATWLDVRYYPDSLFMDSTYNFDLLAPLPDTGGPVTGLTAFLLAVPNVAALVTRLHDRDHSAWWLLWILLPGIGAVVLFVTRAARHRPGAEPVRTPARLTAQS